MYHCYNIVGNVLVITGKLCIVHLIRTGQLFFTFLKHTCQMVKTTAYGFEYECVGVTLRELCTHQKHLLALLLQIIIATEEMLGDRILCNARIEFPSIVFKTNLGRYHIRLNTTV